MRNSTAQQRIRSALSPRDQPEFARDTARRRSKSMQTLYREKWRAGEIRAGISMIYVFAVLFALAEKSQSAA
jgi:hypothetical protein